MALVRDNCLVPTLDAPELGYVRESTSEQYVPDVFYKVSMQRYVTSGASDKGTLQKRTNLSTKGYFKVP